jgi:hypothetical protein
MAARKIPPKAKHPAEIADRTAPAVIAELIRPTPALDGKVKVSAHFLHSYFNTPDTIKNYLGQLDLPFARDHVKDLEQTKRNLATIVTRGFKGIVLEYWENRTMRGIFKLLEKVGATEQRPFVVLENRAQLHDIILERKRIRTSKKGGHTFKDFWGSEVEAVDKALDRLGRKPQQVVIKVRDGKDTKGKPLYCYYMRETPLVTVEYLKRHIPEAEAECMTEAQLKETGQLKITVLDRLLWDIDAYFRIIPLDVAREIHAACPDVRKVTRPLQDFIDYLHRHTEPEIHRSRREIVQVLRLAKEYREQKGRITRNILRYYEIAKRAGYLKDYKTDQKGALEKVDVFFLNEEKIYHLKHRKPKRVAGRKDVKGLLQEGPKR